MSGNNYILIENDEYIDPLGYGTILNHIGYN